MLTAGFPCQDISSAAMGYARTGLAGTRSSLILNALRLVRECPTLQIVFLENSDSFVKHGMQDLLSILHRMEFHTKWGIFTALEAGAPHLRKRWYCLACKGSIAVHMHTTTAPKNEWNRETCSRVMPRSTELRKEMMTRAGLLGNAVVPQTCALAYNVLLQSLQNITIRPSPGPAIKFQLPLVHMKIGKHVILRNLWATPTRTHWHQLRNMIPRRNVQKLANQIFYDSKTQQYIRHKYGYVQAAKYSDRYFCINPNWVEWLQGFPKNWTKI